jgi:antitoxin component YwqK of YwqJK toxin-antitoxin module
LLRKCYYVNDRIHADNVKSYWAHGGLKDIISFEHGIPMGHCRVYSKNGKLAYEGEVIKKKFWYYPRSHKENFVKVFRNDGTVYVGETLGVSISHDAYRQQLPLQDEEEFIDQEEP